MAKHLIKVSGLIWQRNRVSFKQMNTHFLNLVVKRKAEDRKRILELGGLCSIKSSFLVGRPTPDRDHKRLPVLITPCVLNRFVERLVDFVRMRRSRRDISTQQELDFLCQHYQNGYEADKVYFQSFSSNGTAYVPLKLDGGNIRIYLKPTYIMLEDLNPRQLKTVANSQQNNLGYGFSHVLNMSEISLISTDLINDCTRSEEMDRQFEYNITLYGPFLNQTLKSQTSENVLSELQYFAPLIHSRNEWFQIQINSFSLPVAFVKSYNHKLLFKVKLTMLRNEKLNPQKSFHVLSEEIPLDLSDEKMQEIETMLKTNPQGNIDIETKGLIFNIDKLVDSNSERLHFSVQYVFTSGPVHAVLKDYIMRDEHHGWNQLGVPSKYDDSNKEKLVELKNQLVEGKATLKYQMVKHSKKEKDDVPLDFKEGPRLLVGRYCLLDSADSAQACQVVSVNMNGTVKLRLVKTHELLEKNIDVKRLKFIERYGVSVYDEMNRPEELKTAKFKWKCSFKTQNKRLLSKIQIAIQRWQVEQAHKRRLNYQPTTIAWGNLYCSMMKLQGLKKCLPLKQQLQDASEPGQVMIRPYVKVITIQVTNMQLAQPTETVINTQVSEMITKNIEMLKHRSLTQDLGQMASFVNHKNPLGKIFDLGRFSKTYDPDHVSRVSDDKTKPMIKLKFEVYNKQSSKDILLGSFEIPTASIIDLQNQADEQSHMLELQGDEAGILTLQTRFIPDHMTRVNFHLHHHTYNLTAPEAYLHYQSLINPQLFDTFHYQVPLGQYNWQEHLKQEYMNGFEQRIRPLQLKGMDEFSKTIHMIQQQMKKRLAIQYDQKKIFISQEEVRDILIWHENTLRPMRQAFTHNHINLMWARKILSSLEAKRHLAIKFWDEYLNELPLVVVDMYETDFPQQSAQRVEDVVSPVVHSLNLRKDSSKKDYKAPNKLFNSEIGSLIYTGQWEQDKDQKYRDLYDLVHKIGIPNELRSKMWREFFKVQILEFDEVKDCKTMLAAGFDAEKTVFVNYKNYADKFDCLAFKQIDEDVAQYRFPEGYLSQLTEALRNQQILSERTSMRNILKVLILWQQDKKVDGNDISISYGQGILDVIQRLLSVSKFTCKTNGVPTDSIQATESVFWILVGLINIFPRPFSVNDSVLKGDCFSVMRLEIIAFKSLVEQYLPKVFTKLKDFGLPIELLVYGPILSLYSNFFSTELVLRLWDIIFFSFSAKEKRFRKRGLWYILAPAYLVLKRKERQIMEATSCEEIVKVFKSGCTLWYDPNSFIDEVEDVCTELFIEETEVIVRSDIMNLMFGEKLKIRNQKAFDFEEQRNRYQQKIQEMFQVTKEENTLVGEFMELQKPLALDYDAINNSIMKNFREQSVGAGSLVLPTEENVSETLPLSKIHIYLHNRSAKMKSYEEFDPFCVKVTYIQIDEQTSVPRIIATAKNFDPTVPFDTDQINQYITFNYQPGANYVKIELFHPDDLRSAICDSLVCLSELAYDRFTAERIPMRDPKLLKDTSKYSSCLDQIFVSFFLDLKQQSTQKSDFFRIITSFNRRLPDVTDIFNRTLVDFSKDFEKLVKYDREELRTFLSNEQSLQILNESYSYINLEGYGHISEPDFLKISNLLMPARMKNVEKLKGIYAKFTKGQDQVKDLNKSLVKAQPFSLRSFLTSVILMSQCTVDQKTIMLYDLFDLADGSNDCLRPQYVYQLISTVFNRSQYFMPHHELMSIVEYVFNGQVSMVHKAYWTRDIIKIQENKTSMEIKLNLFLQQDKNVDLDMEGTSIDVTTQVQHSFLNYYSVFGTKTVDLNTDCSTFGELKNLLGTNDSGKDLAKQMLKNIKELKGDKNYDYKLVLFCQRGGERFNYYINYDQKSGKLICAGKSQIGRSGPRKAHDFSTYFEKNSARLFLQGVTRPITKEEFLRRVEEIPMFANLIRVETFYQNRVLNCMQPRVPLQTKLLVILVVAATQFRFEFVNQPNSAQQQDESQEGHEYEESNVPTHSFTIKLHCLYDSNLLSDVRQRILQAFRVMVHQRPKLAGEHSTDKIEADLAGGKTWYHLKNHKDNWQPVEDHQRLSELTPVNRSLLLLKLSTVVRKIKEHHTYDCFSFYKHGDKSVEWRPCRVVRRDPIPELMQAEASAIRPIFPAMQYTYWIEFQHQKQVGSHMWCKRNAAEILFSTEYTRLYMKRFQSESVSYLSTMYSASTPNDNQGASFFMASGSDFMQTQNKTFVQN